MSGRYVYDGNNVNFRKEGRTFAGLAVRILKYFLVSVSLAVVYYMIFSLFISTDTERRLKAENRILEKVYPEMEEKEKLLADVVEGLQVRDDEIYNTVFKSPAPDREYRPSADFMQEGLAAADDDIIAYSSSVLRDMERGVSAVEENFRRAFAAMEAEGFVMPPMDVPVDGFSYAMTGASVGDKVSPFYKVKIHHTGLDLVTHAGVPVLAAADGTVTAVRRSRSGMGNVVEISHDGGYLTRYAHLGDIFVSRGRRVRKGTRIGLVGVSGQTFAPHLHYEVMRDTVVCDPVNHFFASVSPDEYTKMAVMSAGIGQSMD